MYNIIFSRKNLLLIAVSTIALVIFVRPVTIFAAGTSDPSECGGTDPGAQSEMQGTQCLNNTGTCDGGGNCDTSSSVVNTPPSGSGVNSGTSPGSGVNSGTSAGSGVNSSALTNPLAKANIGNLCQLVNAVLNIISEIGALVAVLFIIWSGFLFIKAQGNKAELDKAKKTLYTTIIGTAILVGASVITKVLVDTIGQISSSVGGGSGGICS